MSPAGNVDLPWNRSPNGEVVRVLAGSGVLYAGGAFGLVGGLPRGGFAALPLVSEAIFQNGFESMKAPLTIEDLREGAVEGRVFEFLLDEGVPDTAIREIRRLPVARTSGRVFGTRVRLANGQARTVLAMNIEPRDAEMNDHFASFIFIVGSRHFPLARYHDVDAKKSGPAALARFLGLGVEEVFPFQYDLRELVKGDADALRRKVLAEPTSRLSRAELIALAVP